MPQERVYSTEPARVAAASVTILPAELTPAENLPDARNAFVPYHAMRQDDSIRQQGEMNRVAQAPGAVRGERKEAWSPRM
jgi:hypothetical protein